MRTSKFKQATLVAPIAALALVLSACGSEDGAAQPATTSESTQAESSSDDSSDDQSTEETDSSEGSSDDDSSESATESSESSDDDATESSDDATESTEATEATESSETSESTESSPTTESSTDDDSTESTESSTESSSDDDDATTSGGIDADGPAPAIAKPGTKVKVGDSVLIHDQTFTKGHKYYGKAILKATVSKIVKGDPAVFKTFKNPEELKDKMPYYIYTDLEIVWIEGSSNGTYMPIFTGVTKSLRTAGRAISFGGNTPCETKFFQEKEVGAKATKCSFAITDKTDPVIGAIWEGNDYADGSSRDKNQYRQKPVVWLS